MQSKILMWLHEVVVELLCFWFCWARTARQTKGLHGVEKWIYSFKCLCFQWFSISDYFHLTAVKPSTTMQLWVHFTCIKNIENQVSLKWSYMNFRGIVFKWQVYEKVILTRDRNVLMVHISSLDQNSTLSFSKCFIRGNLLSTSPVRSKINEPLSQRR